MSLENLTSEVLEPLEQQTKEVINAQIVTWSQEIYLWMNQALQKVQTVKNIKNKLEKTRAAKENLNNFIIYYKQLDKESEMIQNDTTDWLISGYKLLNSIGEKVRGQEIFYNIYTTSTGDSLASVPQGGKIYSWKLPFETFIQITKAYKGGRLVLGSNRYVNEILSNLEKDERFKIQKEEWPEDKIAAFQLFDNQIRGVADKRWNKVNVGNTLEAFLRFEKNNNVHWAQFSENGYWNSIASQASTAMELTLKNPDPFYKGADLFDLQIKGLKATVANFTTIINALNDTLKILQMNPEGFQILSKHIQQSALPSIKAEVKDSQAKTLEKLKDYFTTNIERDIIVNLT